MQSRITNKQEQAQHLSQYNNCMSEIGHIYCRDCHFSKYCLSHIQLQSTNEHLDASNGAIKESKLYLRKEKLKRILNNE